MLNYDNNLFDNIWHVQLLYLILSFQTLKCQQLFFCKTEKPKPRSVMLPKIDGGRSQPPPQGGKGQTLHTSQAPLDPKMPLTLELQHAGQRHTVSLPTETLDKNKKYYVTFTINSSTSASKKTTLSPIETPRQEQQPGVAVVQS